MHLSRTTWIGTALALLFAAAAIAGATDYRGWSTGTKAAAAQRVLGPPPTENLVVQLPKAFAQTLKRPTLLVYFAPTCPHCRHAAPELAGLAGHLDPLGVDVVGIASGTSSPEAVDEFTKTFGIPFRIVTDTDRSLISALGARSTPSALLVRPGEKGAWLVWDAWYPYLRGYDTLVRMRVLQGKGNPWSAFEPGVYQGNHTCATCHVQETEAWTLTHHAIAWRTLAMRDKHTDAACVDCHVTGAEQPSGWDGDPQSHLVNVGCEACHGPGGPHDGTATVPATTCEGCHDAKHSIAFSYGKGLPLIDHYRSVSMDDEAFRKARLDLIEGRADKGLLAFGEGKMVGSERCKSCHESEHTRWKEAPHSRAMATLQAKQATKDLTCVRCHATPKQSGPPPGSLEGYHLDEGVGCESCHGPGEAHVAAGGGKDNIEGLGEDCPVCVLEALCTSCHDGEWDPDWDLDTRLEGITHGRPQGER